MFIDHHGTYGYASDEAFYWYERETDLWPSAVGWNAILRGAAWQAGLDPRHTILWHLTQKVASGERMPFVVARRFVLSRIFVHVEALLIEFGLPTDYARAVAERVRWWLASIDSSALPYVAEAYWPTPDEWIAIDVEAAARTDLDGRFTLSTNFAAVAAHNTNVSLKIAKRWVHKRIAAHAQQLARELGYGVIASTLVQTRIARWLDSFDP